MSSGCRRAPSSASARVKRAGARERRVLRIRAWRDDKVALLFVFVVTAAVGLVVVVGGCSEQLDDDDCRNAQLLSGERVQARSWSLDWLCSFHAVLSLRDRRGRPIDRPTD